MRKIIFAPLGISVLLVFLYFVLLLINSNGQYLSIGDESVYAASMNSLFDGVVNGNNHPLLAETIWLAIVSLFYLITGTDQGFYWRIGTMLMSIGSLVVFYKVARIFFSKGVSLIGVAFLALDPMFFVFSRLVQLEIPSLFFFLIFLYFYLKYLKTNTLKMLYIGCAFLGLSLAVKVFALSILFIIPLTLLVFRKRFSLTYISSIAASIICEIIIVVSYILGNSIYFFLHTKVDFFTYTYSQFRIDGGFSHIPPSDPGSPAWSWFTIPQILILYRVFEKHMVESVVAFQSPLFFLLTIPSLALLVYVLIRRKSKDKFLFLEMLIIFFAFYIPWFFPITNTYYYYILSLLPFIILFFLKVFMSFKILKPKILYVLITVQVVLFLLYYPLLIGLKTPYSYEKILMSYSLYTFKPRNKIMCQFCSPLGYPKEKKSK